MKRTLLCVLTAMTVMSSCVTALAAKTDYDVKDVYNGVENSVGDLNTTGEISPNAYKTVIISRVADINGEPLSEEEVVYVDQNTSVYSSAVEFMLMGDREDMAYGYYQARMGTVSTTAQPYDEVYFIIGDFEVDPADKLEVLDGAVAYGTDKGVTYYKKGFQKKLTIDEYNSFKSIKLISEDGTECIGAIKFGVDDSDYKVSGNTHGYTWKKPTLSGEGEVTVALQVYAIPEGKTGFSLYFSEEEVTQVLNDKGEAM